MAKEINALESIVTGQRITGQVTVDGTLLNYRAMPLPSGQVSVEQSTFLDGEATMRTLTDGELNAITMLAREIGSVAERDQLLADLKGYTVEATVPDGSILTFSIDGYQRPSDPGQNSFISKDGSEVAGIVNDSDGAEMDVLLLADLNHRVWDFEIVRYDPGVVISPDWSTFKVKS